MDQYMMHCALVRLESLLVLLATFIGLPCSSISRYQGGTTGAVNQPTFFDQSKKGIDAQLLQVNN
jgi:phosphate/sulfate permease